MRVAAYLILRMASALPSEQAINHEDIESFVTLLLEGARFAACMARQCFKRKCLWNVDSLLSGQDA